MINAGVLNIQGDVDEHVYMLKKLYAEMKIDGEIRKVKSKDDLKNLDALIIPGGESTTIQRLLKSTGMFDVVRERALNGELGVMGTCAGAILVSKDTGDSRVTPLGLIDIKVKRNAYGRQYSSFQVDVEIKGLDKPFPAVFIRAPVIESVGIGVEILSMYNNDIIFVAKDKIFALTFHPELTNDTRIHRMFAERVGGISTGD